MVEDLLDFSECKRRMTLRLEKIDVLAGDETVFVFKERALREGVSLPTTLPSCPLPDGRPEPHKTGLVNILIMP